MAEHVANTTTIIFCETVTTTTRTSKGSQMPSASSISHYLDVVVVLAQKDFKVRYRNSVLGFLWSLLNPLAYMLILTLVFSFLLRVSIPDFAPWVLIGLLVWRFFSIGTAQGLGSIVANPSLLTLSTTEVGRFMLPP